MKRNFFATLIFVLLALFVPQTIEAQSPVATPHEAVAGLLNRIGGGGAAEGEATGSEDKANHQQE